MGHYKDLRYIDHIVHIHDSLKWITPRARHRNAILLSKDKLSLENEYVAIPVSLFLLLA